MAFARIVTVLHGTVIRSIKWDCKSAMSCAAVDKIANTLDSIIEQDRKALRVEVDYTGCIDELGQYDPHE